MPTPQTSGESPRKRPAKGQQPDTPQQQLQREEEMFRPMTIEEYNARIDRAMEDLRAGRFLSHEEVFKKYEQWL
jgi:hypothetical protein